MTRTIVESKTKTAIIGFDQPFCVIGERINPTGRKKLAAELEAGDFSTVERDAVAQVACGATVLDVNAGVVYNSNPNPNETEPPLMRKMIELVQGLVEVPLCIDSSVPAALEAGLAACEGRPLVNSVTGEEERMEFVFPLVKKYNVPVVAISNDDTGISEDPDVRFAVAKKIVERAADFGIPAHDIVVDPLVMPVGAMGDRRRAGLHPGAAAARGARREHHLRRVQHLVRAAEPARHQQRLPADGGRRRDDQRDHEPVRPAGAGRQDRREAGRDGGAWRRPARGMDDEAFLQLFNLGSTEARPGKEMEAIKAANFLLANDPSGADWIRFNRPAGAALEGGRARPGRRRRA